MPAARSALLAAAWLSLTAARPSAAVEPEAEPGFSASFEAVLAGGRQWGGAGARGGLPAAGFALMLRYRALEAGPVLVGSATDETDGWYLGLAAGLAWDPAPWARLRATAELGRHTVGAESAYAGLPLVSTELAYAGVRVTALTFVPVPRSVWYLFSRRVGVGLDLAMRSDLQHASVTPSVPPELAGTASPKELGGTLASIGLVVVLEY